MNMIMMMKSCWSNKMTKVISEDRMFKFLNFLINKRRKTPLILPMMTTHLVDHCNLNCKGCDHCAPLAETFFVDLKVLEKDFKEMSKLFDHINYIYLQGGEPLLHPELDEILKISRKIFPKSRILLSTNGILLKNIYDTFWDTCRSNNIEIYLTKYPIDLNYNEIEKTIIENKLILVYADKSNIVKKTLYKNVFDINGGQNPHESYDNCFHIKYFCTHLQDGKFYPCTIIKNSEHFSKFFDKKLKISDKDYIDIYSISSGEEILNFISTPVPFCRYCKTKSREFGLPWESSQKQISEWL